MESVEAGMSWERKERSEEQEGRLDEGGEVRVYALPRRSAPFPFPVTLWCIYSFSWNKGWTVVFWLHEFPFPRLFPLSYL